MTKYSTQLEIGKVGLLQFPKQNFYYIFMNFLTCAPNVRNNDAKMVMVCQLSKLWARFASCAKQLWRKKWHNWIRHGGFPQDIANDRGLLFQS